jgi:hypothetical protein
MKKTYIFIIFLLYAGSMQSQNNAQTPYVSEAFSPIFFRSVQCNIDTKAHNNIYTMHNEFLFVTTRRAFVDTIQSGYAKVITINTFTETEEIYYILPSPEYLQNGGILSRIWIWTIAVSDSLLFVVVDEGIWVYNYTHDKKYEYLKTISVKEIAKLEIVDNYLHAFIDNNDGFNWVKINLMNDEIENVRKLVLKNSFFLQISPVKIISITNNTLYLLQQNTPSIEKYSLTGELLATYDLEIPNWNRIPDEITQKLDSIENKTEKLHALSKFQVFEYHFMHFFYVFSSERFFLIAVDKNKSTETFITPYFIQIVGDSTIIEPYSVKLPENEKFGEKYFPFLTPRAEGNLIFAQSNNYITQINQGSSVTWQNKTQKEFRYDVNQYHRDNDPIEKMETYRFVKNYIHADSILFLDYDNLVFNLNDIKSEKAIFIISQNPQCATCIKLLWNLFSNKTDPDVEIYAVASNCPTYLLKKEKIKETNVFLKTEYTPLFIDNKQLNSATRFIFTQRTNPLVILFNKKLQHIEVISSYNIIDDMMGNISPSFIHTINNFMNN